jgi:NitT/TauT family transport system substrate-binding protein
MAKSRAGLAKLALGFVGICLFFACLARPVLATAPQPVRLMLQWSHQAQFAGYYVAKEKGFYQEQGLGVSIVPGGPGLDPADSLIRGEVDFASLWLSTALSRSEQSVRLAKVAQIVNASNLVLITRNEDQINRPAELSGRKISIWGGDFRAPYLAWLQSVGATPQIYPQYYSVNLFLLKGVQACSAMYYNEVHMVYQTGIDMEELKLFFLQEDGFGFPEDGIYTTEERFRKNPELARKFREATLRGWRYAAEHQTETLDIVMQYVTRDKVLTNRPHMKWMLEKILRSVIPDAQDRWTFGSLSRQDYARTVQVMTQQGMIRSAPSYEEFTAGGLGYVP